MPLAVQIQTVLTCKVRCPCPLTDVLLWYASTDLVKEEEELIFPFESMVSELGGALGLFLGFSIFGLFDSLFVVLHTIFAKLFGLKTKH